VIDLPTFLGFRRWPEGRAPTHVETPAEAKFLARIRWHEDYYDMGRLPYWLRYFDSVLQAEYECRMDALAAEMRRLDREALAHSRQSVFGRRRDGRLA
jgi:hypothetical protein